MVGGSSQHKKVYPRSKCSNCTSKVSVIEKMGNINSRSTTTFRIDATVRVVVVGDDDDGRSVEVAAASHDDGIVESTIVDVATTAAVRRAALKTSKKFKKDAKDKVFNIICAMVPLYDGAMAMDDPYEEKERLDKISHGFQTMIKEYNEMPIDMTEPFKFSTELITLLSDQSTFHLDPRLLA